MQIYCQTGQLIDKYQELLHDAGVTAFSFWEKELPKLAADPRFSGNRSLTETRWFILTLLSMSMISSGGVA